MNIRYKMAKICPLFALFAVLALGACKSEYVVMGNSAVHTLDGKRLYLKAFDGYDLANLDSSEVLHGKFEFNGVLDSAMMVSLFMEDESLMPLVLENTVVNIHIGLTDQYVTGTPLNDSLYSFIRKKNRIDAQVAELPRKESRMIMDGVDEDVIYVRLSDEANRLAAENERLVMDFISDNFDNVMGAGVFMIMTSNYPYPVMTPQIETILMKATPYFKNQPYVKRYLDAARVNMEKLGLGWDDEDTGEVTEDSVEVQE